MKVPLVLLGLMVTRVEAAEPAGVEPIGLPGLWRRLELKVGGVPSASNPFDPEVIAVDATITAPSGAKITVPAFWFQDYGRRLTEGREVLEPRGAPEWRLRFTPTEPGRHAVSVAVRVAGKPAGALASTRIDVPNEAPKGRHGWVRNAPGGRDFETSDGRRLRLLGANVCWPGARGTYDYDKWFPAMAEAGENFARLWFSPWSIGIEHEKGTLNRYSLPDAWQLDYVLGLAEQHGLYILIAFDHHGMYMIDDPAWGGSNNFWRSSNPYSADLGGPCATPNDFFTNAKARALYKKRLRYLVARWGYSPFLLSWQFFNEIDNAYIPRSNLVGADVTAWHEEMGGWLRANDPFRHLISTSLTGGVDRPELWTLPEMDFAVYHSYGEGNPAQKLATLSADFVKRYKKPFMIGEFGVSARAWNIATDPHLRGFRQGLWGGALGGSVGSSLSWWWEDLHEDRTYALFAAMRDILGGAGWNDGDWTPVAFAGPGEPPAELGEPFPDGEPFNADLALNTLRRNRVAGAAAIADPLAAARGAERLSAYLAGPKDAPLQQAITLDAVFASDARLVLRVNSVASDAALVVKVDGAPAARLDLVNTDGKAIVNGEINREIAAAVPAGRHRVEIGHDGKDWVYLDSVRLERVRPAPFAGGWRHAPEAIGLRQGNRAIVYVHSPYTAYPAGALRPFPPAVSGGSITLDDWPSGAYRARWSDPRTGNAAAVTEALGADNTLVVPLPELVEDLAAVIEPRR